MGVSTESRHMGCSGSARGEIGQVSRKLHLGFSVMHHPSAAAVGIGPPSSTGQAIIVYNSSLSHCGQVVPCMYMSWTWVVPSSPFLPTSKARVCANRPSWLRDDTSQGEARQKNMLDHQQPIPRRILSSTVSVVGSGWPILDRTPSLQDFMHPASSCLWEEIGLSCSR